MRFDVMVIGAGSAGATMAALLSAKSTRRVLLVEAGEDYRSSETPEAIAGPNFADAIRTGRFHWTELLATVTGARPAEVYLSGRGVGGSSAINVGGAGRGLPHDFDRWQRRGCEGWSWQEVLPAFVAIEQDLDFAAPYHGAAGPLPVRREPDSRWGVVSRALGEAAAALGHGFSADVNAPESSGVSPVAWNRREGRRVSTNDAFLEPARGRANLKIAGNTTVERLLFSGARVVGAALRGRDGRLTVEADQVIVCAGAIQSPALLLRSGIGNADELRALGLPVVADLPGVGQNLQDHPMVCLSFPLSAAAQQEAPGLPTGCVLRCALDERPERRNELQIMPLERIPMEQQIVQGGFLVSFLRPSSSGSVRLASADPAAAPLVDFRMLSSDEDVAAMRRALRQVGELTRAAPLSRVLASGLYLGPDLPLDRVDDAGLTGWLRAACIPHFHAAGTCRMGAADDAGAVADSRGRVRGIDGLRVVDASIMPDLPTAATHMTTVMLAQHIHDRESWGA